ncbi:chaplin [Streptomyces celluloflavus]|uniref:chaplin n=1 Tax=Streptomyces celluloflavus TaxID=58344 RepID=UPI0037AD33AE
MKRIVKTAALATATCTMVLGGAGIATAHNDGGRHDGRHGGGHDGRHEGRFDGRRGDRFDGGRREGRRGGWDGGRREGRHGAAAYGFAAHSPGVLSGNTIQVPVNVPINLCGNSIDVIGLLNPAFGNTCIDR